MKKLQQYCKYTFSDSNLLKTALTHRSFGNNNNERLEFLGDSFLNIVISEELFKKFPNINEGDLSRLRANLICGKTLVQIARKINLSDFLILGRGELKSAGFRKESILEDAVEAIVGAIFLDSDYKRTKEVVLFLYEDILSNIDETSINKDFKTQLQEFLQKYKLDLPVYTLLKITGKDHNAVFYVQCELKNKDITTKASAKSIKEAEQRSAELLLKKIKNEF